MEFHDILHGLIRFEDQNIRSLLAELLDSPEIHRLRNMRQMNFDVPLIQELGRSRRLPHSIGVAHIALTLAHKAKLSSKDTQVLLCAALLHDAAIPPYGHLVESEFKSLQPTFNHEQRLSTIIHGTISSLNIYDDIVPGRQLGLLTILNKYQIEPSKVLEMVCPPKGSKSAISADVDIDNIDNVHRMAAMLGWDGARTNVRKLVERSRIDSSHGLSFSESAIDNLNKWLDYRQRIYTMIIAHPECIPQNALQADLARLAVREQIIAPDDWKITEPVFEERLRNSPHTKLLADQLISGCQYQLIDYVWFKNYENKIQLTNAQIVHHMLSDVPVGEDFGYFVWNEKGLISREVSIFIQDDGERTVGRNSSSCMIALIKKTPGKPRRLKKDHNDWRLNIADAFVKMSKNINFTADFPETYTGNFMSSIDELQF